MECWQVIVTICWHIIMLHAILGLRHNLSSQPDHAIMILHCRHIFQQKATFCTKEIGKEKTRKCFDKASADKNRDPRKSYERQSTTNKVVPGNWVAVILCSISQFWSYGPQSNLYCHIAGIFQLQRAHSLASSLSHDFEQWSCFPPNTMSRQLCRKLWHQTGNSSLLLTKCWLLLHVICQ